MVSTNPFSLDFFNVNLLTCFGWKFVLLKKIVCEKTTQEKANSKDCEKRNGKDNEINLLPK
jgi:hypothetical protein